MMEKAAGLPADHVFLELEDAVAFSEKKAARGLVVDALNTLDFGSKVRTVRINDVSTPFAYGDIIEVVSGAGQNIDCLIVPKVQDASHVHFVDRLLDGLESDLGLTRRIALEVQIESARGFVAIADIVRASSRVETVIFGPGDYALDLGVPGFNLGMIDPQYPGHQWHWALSEIVNHAHAAGLEAIDGPYTDFSDREGYLESARRARLLGCTGKWCIHPNQIEWANEVFSPSEEECDYAERLIEAYRQVVEDGVGATVFDGKLIDEASRKHAEKVMARARIAGVRQTRA